MASGIALAFVLLETAAYPEADALVDAAAQAGLTLTPGELPEEPDGPRTYEVDGIGTLMLMLVAAPHPDAAEMPSGLASPDEEELERVKAHYIVTVLGLPEDPRVADPLLATLTASVVRSSSALAAMLGHGVVFHRAEFFADVATDDAGSFPMLVCVDVTIAPEPDDRVSFLTHGLTRYGREEFYITASASGEGAVDFLLSMATWMLSDTNKTLPTGDTVGRTGDEKIAVQRVANPTGEGPEVVRLDLDI